MKSRIASFAFLLCLTGCAATPVTTDELIAERAPPAVEVMVLGTYHMGNPGADMVNMEADDVLAPARQAELEDLARRLAEFNPTAIMVETESHRPDLLDERFLSFEPEQLTASRNEITQVAYRLASEMGIKRVYGVDQYEGEISFFPFDKVQAFEEARGDKSLSERLIGEVQAEVSAFGELQKTHTIPQLLALENDPAKIDRMHTDFYYGLFELADANSQPGAALNYGWFARNAQIFGKIAAATEPGDRVIVLFGSGHAYWLRHFAENAPGFTLVEPVPYLVD